MKIWIDAQLSPAIAAWINRTDNGIEAKSVRAVGLRGATDSEIFEEARNQNIVAMSKDDDFTNLVE
jgi:predicted nuclease of predicted toxin-antitoxin system